MTRALFGLIKGLLVGFVFSGVLLWSLPLDGFLSSLLSYIGCAVVGAVVGLVCGRAPWKTETVWVPVLRVMFGAIVGLILYGLGHTFLPSFSLFYIEKISAQPISLHSSVFLAVVIGVSYGIFVEIDDGAGKKQAQPASS